MCNMAVKPEFRRKGYGLLLLEAAEEIARLGGQRDLYLHLRSDLGFSHNLRCSATRVTKRQPHSSGRACLYKKAQVSKCVSVAI